MELPIRCNSIALYAVKGRGRAARYLLIRRTGKRLRGHWEMIAGKIEKDETAWQAALRELKEETGLQAQALYSADTLEAFYAPRADVIDLTPVFVAFVDENARVQLSDEHDAYEWLTAAHAGRRLAFSEQRRILKHIEALFVQKKPRDILNIPLE